MTAAQAVLFALFLVCASFTQALTGFAFTLVLLGLAGLFEVAPLTELTNVATTLSVLNALQSLRGSRRHLDMAAYRSALIGCAPGLVAGVFLLGWLSANVVGALRALLGVTVFACALSMLLPKRTLEQRSGNATFGACGALCGLLGGLFSSGGPPVIYLFYRQPLPLEVIRGTLLAVLTTMSVGRTLLMLATGQFSLLALQLTLLATPLVLASAWLLERHPPRWSRQGVLRLVCVLLLATGVGLVATAWRDLVP